MNHSDKIRRIQLKQNIESQFAGSIEEKINRYLEIEHQGSLGIITFQKLHLSVFTFTATAILLVRS